MEGWICLHRKLLDNPIVCKNANYLAVWIYLILNATHTNIDMMFDGKRITLKPGQLITGRDSISKKLSIPSSTVQRILKTFENEHQIEQQTSTRNRLITLINWQQYQESEQQNKQRVNNEWTTNEHKQQCNNVTMKQNSINNKIINITKDNHIIELYNTICTNLSPAKALNEKRTKQIKLFTKQFNEEQIKEIFTLANESEFIQGKNDRGWRGNLDFILRIDKATAILEGVYNKNKVKTKEKEKTPEEEANDRWFMEMTKDFYKKGD